LPLKPMSKLPYMELLPTTPLGQASWSLLAQRPASLAEIKAWFDHDPSLNYGIITGKASLNGFYCVDIDRPKKMNLHVPPTTAVKTGRGSHYYFQHQEDIETKTFPWGELKGRSSYIVGPGSIHESGHVYDFWEELSISEIGIAELPEWALNGNVGHSGEAAGDQATLHNTNTSKDTKEEWHRNNSVTMPQGMDALERLNQNPDIAIKIMELCGRSVKALNKAFSCPIPGHSEAKPSAALYHEQGRPIILHDFHGKDPERRFWPLVDVYASCKTGKALKLREGERAIWWLRALHEIGYISPPVLPKYSLPGDAPADAVKCYEGFCYLLELRQLYEPSDTAPYNRNFAARWCRCDVEVIRRGMRWLLKEGYLFIAERGRPNTNKDGPALTMFKIGRPKGGFNHDDPKG